MNPLLILLAGMVVVLGGILWLRLHAFLALLLGAFTVAVLTPPDEALSGSAAERVADGFGTGCAKIGILIAMAAIIGKCLLESGAAERIVLSLRRLLGEKGTPAAFTASGFLLGIPVFFDTVFYLLMPLGKALRMRTGKNYLLYILTIVAGATMAHSLVPPTPGPALVASELAGVEVGEMMLGGLVVGFFTICAGYAYACWANRRWDIPLRPSAELSAADLEAMRTRDEADLPPLWLSLAPILLPVVLIAAGTFSKNLDVALPGGLVALGDKNVALALAAALALAMLAKQKGMALRALSPAVQAALSSAGMIILVTAAGSAFGAVLRESGLTQTLEGNLPESHFLLLLLAFGFTTVVRIAQGSATVAMITAVGIVGPLVQAAGPVLPYHPVYIALAIGCGSKPVMWMNDSGFWIIGRMTGMKEAETLKTASVMMALMGLTGLVVVLLGAWLCPFR